MKFDIFRFSFVCALTVAALLLPGVSTFAQDGEPVVVDEVVAQVNDGVITLSRIRREMKQAVEGLVGQGRKPEDAQREVESKKNEIIANLINEELIMQQGKEMGADSEIEAEVNGRFAGVMKQEKLTSLEELYKAMRSQNIEPDEIRAIWRRDITRQMVFTREVNARLYHGFSAEEVKAYFDKNREKFRKPETVSLSEIFLSYAGRDEAQVRTQAADIVKKARVAGADFAALVEQYSERTESKTNQGKVGTFPIADLEPKTALIVKDVKTGGITEPLQREEGVTILRVDERAVDSATPVFEESKVREAMLAERVPAERRKFMQKLRTDGYIKINEQYKAAVLPILTKDDTTVQAVSKN